jgi:two-component system KDP operon response regulator KdpE
MSVSMPCDDPSQTRTRVLVVDDEPQIRRFLDISLRAQGYAVAAVETGSDALRTIENGDADLVILDLGLPDLDGLDVLKALRDVSAVPVIVLTVRASEGEKVKVLDAGANDYVTKPFGIQELMARVRALLRRQHPQPDAPVVFDDGRLRVDLTQRSVLLDGTPLPLARKEYALLALLVRNSGRILTQAQILRELWGPLHERDTHYLRVLVGKLRQKLDDDPASPRWILTEPGVGLRFIGEKT